MHHVTQDIRYAARQLLKSPSFTAAAILTLALGIGANLTVFLILYGVILRPLPFPQPQQLVRVERAFPQGQLAPAYSGTKFLFLSRASRTLQSSAAYDYLPSHVNLIQGAEAIPINALRTTSGFFHVFGMEPSLGRSFSQQETMRNAPDVAILSDAAWRLRFAGRADILGQSITLGNTQYTVIGVADRRFKLDTKVDVWVPLRIEENAADQSNNYNFVARLKPGVTRTQADDDLRRGFLQLKDTYPALWQKDESVSALDFHDSLVGSARPALEMLMMAVLLVLLIVSANIISLLLTRAVARRRELRLRVALGASGWRLFQQLSIENGLLCLLGGIAGVVLAHFAAPLLMALSPLDLPQFTSLDLSPGALLFAAALVFGCGLLFTIVPARESRQTRLHDGLRLHGTEAASTRSLAQRALVIGEVAVSLVLLVGAGLLLTSFWKLVHISPGFRAENVLTFKTSFTEEQAATSALFGDRLDRLSARLGAEPGVAEAAAVDDLPTQLVPDLPFNIAGRSKADGGPDGDAKYMPITSRYFAALEIPVLAGRAFTLSDSHGTQPVMIVNQQFARAHFPGQTAVGAHIRIGDMMGPAFADGEREIVGVVGNVKQSGLDADAPEIMYLPAAQIPDALTRMGNGLLGTSWVVRVKGPGADIVSAARHIFMDDAHTPLLSVEPMQDVISASLAQQRFTMVLLSAFGLISLVLGASGLYGVISYNVARQTKEIGLRMAVGAGRPAILWMVLREALLLLGAGLGVGVAVSFAGTRLLRSLLYGVAPHDPATLAAMCLLLLSIGLFAAWWPARRAASVEPMQALRAE